MRFTINKLYGYKVCNNNQAKSYTSSYYLALLEKQRLEKNTSKKWIVKPTLKHECRKVWRNCPFRNLGETNENKLTSKQ